MTPALLLIALIGSGTVRVRADAGAGWTLALGRMTDSRWAASSAVLPGGASAIVAGGFSYDTGACVASADVYDEASNAFHPSRGKLAYPRDFATASTLPDGRVLIAGGYNTILGTLATAEVYDRNADRFTLLPSRMSYDRELFTATPLADGRILCAGGFDTHRRHTLATADLFDPATMTFRPVQSSLTDDRFGQAAVRLADGRVLIVGGKHWRVGRPDRPLASAEIFDPATLRFRPCRGALSIARDRPTATLLPDGRVLICGGQNGGDGPLPCELFDPATETFSVDGSLAVSRMAHSAVLLADGTVLVAGGWSPALQHTTASVEIVDPSLHRTRPGPTLPFDGHDFAVDLFEDGGILCAGGKTAGGGREGSNDRGALLGRP